MFGDFDPEDAYDVDDPAHERLRNVIRRLAWLVDRHSDNVELANRLERIRLDLMRIRDELVH